MLDQLILRFTQNLMVYFCDTKNSKLTCFTKNLIDVRENQLPMLKKYVNVKS